MIYKYSRFSCSITCQQTVVIMLEYVEMLVFSIFAVSYGCFDSECLVCMVPNQQRYNRPVLVWNPV